MEWKLICWGNQKRPQFFPKFNFLKMEDSLICFGNGKRPKFLIKIIIQPETFKIKTMVVAPLWVE